MVRFEVVFRTHRERRLTADELRAPGMVLHRWLDHLFRGAGRGADGRIALAVKPFVARGHGDNELRAGALLQAAVSVFGGADDAGVVENEADAVLVALMTLATMPNAPIQPVRIDAVSEVGIAVQLWHEDDGADWVEAVATPLDAAALVRRIAPMAESALLVVETVTPLSITSTEKRAQSVAVLPTATRVVKAALRRLQVLWPAALPVALGGATVFELEGLAMQLDRAHDMAGEALVQVTQDGGAPMLHYGSTTHERALALPVFSGQLVWRNAEPLAALMHLMQWTQVGRGTAMGLGVVRVGWGGCRMLPVLR